MQRSPRNRPKPATAQHPALNLAPSTDVDGPIGEGAAAILTASASTWLADRTVWARVAAWATSESGRERWFRTDEGQRTAAGVAAAVLELEREPQWARWANGSVPPDKRAASVPVDLDELAARAGTSIEVAGRALDALAGAGVIERATEGGHTVVRTDPACHIVASACAAVAWPQVRAALHAAGSPVAAPLAVLRALVMSLAGAEAGQASPELRASIRELADATRYGRTAVADALNALQTVGLIDSRVRAGRPTRFVVCPAAFKHDGSALGQGSAPVTPDEVARAQISRTTRRPKRATPRSLVADGGVSRPRSPHHAPILLGEFAGTPIMAPAGTPITLEQDDSGRWYCRVGQHLRLGPADDES